MLDRGSRYENACPAVLIRMSQVIRLIDCVLYNGEPVAALRLANVYPHVDEIVIVEARQTFTGLSKERLFIEQYGSVFLPYLDKITFLVVDFPSAMRGNAWDCEHYQRNYPADHIRQRWAGNPYVVMVCDIDEVPSELALLSFRRMYCSLDMPAYLVMHLLYYNFSWWKVDPWVRAFVLNDRCMARPGFSFEWGRTGLRRDRFVNHAGHHLSYFMSVDDIRRKLNSFSHTEVNLPCFNNVEWLRCCIEGGRDIIGREYIKERKRLVPTPPEVRATLPVGWEELQKALTN